jgi:hypothetical protein
MTQTITMLKRLGSLASISMDTATIFGMVLVTTRNSSLVLFINDESTSWKYVVFGARRVISLLYCSK